MSDISLHRTITLRKQDVTRSLAVSPTPREPYVPTWPERDAIAGDMEGADPAQGFSITKMLTLLVLLLGVGIVCAFAIIGVLVLKNSDQHTRLDQLGNKTNVQQQEIDQLRSRVLVLERK